MLENEERKEESTLKQFQRNRYFYGKLMTVRDFELEQEYFNDKRYLLNKFTYGKGLLCGFSSLKLKNGSSDKISIRFEDGGLALDSRGREIVVPEGEEKPVLDEDGHTFKRSEFKDSTYLYLRYRTSFSEFVRAASNPLSCDEITCSNRILEDFEVIASSKYPAKKEEYGSLSQTSVAESDEKVFFATVKEDPVKKDLSIDERDSGSRKYYLQTRRQETITRSSATGVVYFKQPTKNSVTSDFINPKLGTGPIFIQLGLEDEKNGQIQTGYYGESKENGSPKFQLRTILDPVTGLFKVEAVFAGESERSSIKVRWWAFSADSDIPYNEIKDAVKFEVSLVKYKFASAGVKGIVENGLCESGAKNCRKFGVIVGGDHYATKGNDVALNGNPKKLVEIVKEQEGEPMDVPSKMYIGGDWTLKVDNYNRLKQPTARIILMFGEQEMRSFNVSKGDLITYCEDIEGETGVPLFVTYVDDIYIPVVKSLIGIEAKVVLKYTWAVSKKVRHQA